MGTPSDKLSRFLKILGKKSFTEMMLCSFLLVLIPAYYCVDVFHVLPCMYRLTSVWYLAHVLPLTFVVFNVLTNFAAVICADSSIVSRLLTPAKYSLKDCNVDEYCNICQCTVPLRCWHCDTCDVCILTRDHHCTFSTTCVGHYNRRYFLWFLLYFSAVSFYEIILIGYYTYHEVALQFSDLMVLIPIQFIITGFHLTVGQFFVFLLALNLVAVTMSTLLLIYHLDKVRRGLVCHENHNKYNFGFVQNMKTVFGEKWYITWVSPLVESKLPYNGLDWQNHINQYKMD